MLLEILPTRAMLRRQSGKTESGANNGEQMEHCDSLASSSLVGRAVRDKTNDTDGSSPHNLPTAHQNSAKDLRKLTKEQEDQVMACMNPMFLALTQRSQRDDNVNIVTESPTSFQRQEERRLGMLGPYEHASMMARSLYASAGPPLYSPFLASSGTAMCRRGRSVGAEQHGVTDGRFG